MRGTSRGAAAAGEKALGEVFGSLDSGQLAEELFASCGSIDGNATLRRALTDPSREGSAKADLVRRLFSGKVTDQTVHVVATLAGQRWADERDFSDTIENLAVQAVVDRADRRGKLQDLEDELFRFERIVAGDPELRDVLTNRQGNGAGKAEIVRRLLDGKTTPETVRLAQQAVQAPRGRRLDAVLEAYLALAAKRHNQLTAVVTSATALSEQETARLAEALGRSYGRQIQIQPIVDPSVVGGLKVKIGDEVIDGTIARKLQAVRRHFGG
ncbi:F0F1 ATP synthase subunit delta [Nostocoides jenkinsii]|uniref:ATP synthase subunit delta n=1 Tax=Nostocoides jenkinsii Ben 74 TaxID=1193518 RepID=A0A077ME96_9MICO|nr:F0F1 ATP synthase subunit delta [Tetrasphaera jenkinsii]CCI53198.1 ATP synthase subunit delta [Tetrasphaera jenkinsii Ben 74]